MKPILKLTACILLAGAIIFASCSKDNPVNNTPYNYLPSPVNPNLSGQEFIFNDLTWGIGDFSGIGTADMYLGTPVRTYLFPSRLSMEVFIKLDTSSVWLNVKRFVYPSSGTPWPGTNIGYCYAEEFGSLWVLLLPVNNQLLGTKASIKVKFL